MTWSIIYIFLNYLYLCLFQFKDLMNKIDKDDDEVDDEGNPITQVWPTTPPPQVLSSEMDPAKIWLIRLVEELKREARRFF